MLLVFKYLSQFNDFLQENANKNTKIKMGVWLKDVNFEMAGPDKAFLY